MLVYPAAGRVRLHFPGLVGFELSPEEDTVRATPYSALDRDWLRGVFSSSVIPLILQARGLEVLHASGVLGRRGVVALCADSGVGKSTLAMALASRGHRPWADDAVAIDLRGGAAVCLALPFRLRPRSTEPRDLPVLEDMGLSPQRTSMLAGVVCLERSSGPSPAVLKKLGAADAFPAMLRHAYCLRLFDRAEKTRLACHYLNLAERVPAFELRYGSGRRALEAAVDELEELLATTSVSDL